VAGRPSKSLTKSSPTAVTHGEREDLPRVGVKRVQEAAVRAESLVANSFLAQHRRSGDRVDERERPVGADRVGRDRSVAEVRDEDVAAVLRHRRPADLAARVRDALADGPKSGAVGRRRCGADRTAERFSDDKRALGREVESVRGWRRRRMARRLATGALRYIAGLALRVRRA
jgi:hypothetical protein